MEEKKDSGEIGSESSSQAPGERGSSAPNPYDETVRHTRTSPSDPSERSASSLPIPKEVFPLSEDPSRCLKQYVLVEEIGKGGMGAVWRAWDTKLIRWVAVKFLSTTNEMSIRRFEREAQLSAQLRHPNIASVHEVNKEEGRHFLTMDFIDGPSIGKADLSERDLLETYLKVCRAVHYAHGRSIIHRDIKPENILIGKDGEPYVTDFGLAKVARTESSLSLTGSILGTPVFMSPEQAEGDHKMVDALSDVYSLGATLYTLLTGHPPFEGADMTTILEKISLEDPTPATDLNPEISQELETIILKAMAKEKSARYKSAGDLSRDIEKYLQEKSIEAKRPGPVRPLVRKIKRHGGKIIAATAALVLVVVWISLSSRSGETPVDTGVVQYEKEWKKGWNSSQRELAFYGFEASSPDTVKRAREVITTRIPPSFTEKVPAWFQAQVKRIPLEKWPKETWMEKRAEARRILDWCRMIGMVLEGEGGDFSAIREELHMQEARFTPVAGYRGTIVLRIFVWPYAELRSLGVGETWVIRDGEKISEEVDISGESLFTPLEIRNLDIGDYRFLLVHDELGAQEVRLSSGDLKHGKTYVCSGSLREPDSIRLSPLP